jgi:hypothetical protein
MNLMPLDSSFCTQTFLSWILLSHGTYATFRWYGDQARPFARMTFLCWNGGLNVKLCNRTQKFPCQCVSLKLTVLNKTNRYRPLTTSCCLEHKLHATHRCHTSCGPAKRIPAGIETSRPCFIIKYFRFPASSCHIVGWSGSRFLATAAVWVTDLCSFQNCFSVKLAVTASSVILLHV